MGNFYTNFTLKTAAVDKVLDTLRRASRTAFVSAAQDGAIVVYDAEADTQDISVIQKLGRKLSKEHKCPALAMMNHDDDVLCYWLFDRGKLIDSFNSAPDYFDDNASDDRGGNVKLLCKAFGKRAAASEVQRILHEAEYDFALFQHRAICDALDLPRWAVGSGYATIEADKFPKGLSKKKMRQVGALTPSVKDRVTVMIRDVITPVLKEHGFRRTGRTFWRNSPEVCQVATFTMSRWGSRDKSSFDIELGVFWHKVEEIVDNPAVGKLPPLERHCTFRINMFNVFPRELWHHWEVSQETDYVALGQSVIHEFLEYGVEWLDYRSDLSKVLEWHRYRTPMGAGRYSTVELLCGRAQIVFMTMLGKTDAAIERLKGFVQAGYADDARRIAKRLGIKFE